MPVQETWVDDEGQVQSKEALFDADEGVRFDTNAESLARLKPVFKANGTVTAGNSSQTSDGAAAVVVMSGRRQRQRGCSPWPGLCPSP